MSPKIAHEALANAPQVCDGQTPLPQFSRCIKIPTRSARAFQADGGQVSLVGSHGLVCS
jgi:hypothetical protein